MRGKGHPRSFETEEEFMEQFEKYIDKCICEERLANIAGFCAFARITRETYYKQKEYYSDTFKVIEQILEDAALNHKATSMGIFYLKNKFGYVDKMETVNTNNNFNKDMTEEEALKIIEEAKKKGIL